MNRSAKISLLTGLFLILGLSGCSNSTSSEQDTRYFEFRHENDAIDYTMVAATSDPDVIAKLEQELQKPFGDRNRHINGDIARGNKAYNGQWSWYFIPNEWDLVEASVEVCDGRPGMVEENIDYWVDQVGYFCPWSSRVVREVTPTIGG
ncbi:MAG: hypothetical protein U5K69_12155 [Balneolaceae bacterium]|nr:hypothetical protein [Balneolaceae bacterium]